MELVNGDVPVNGRVHRLMNRLGLALWLALACEASASRDLQAGLAKVDEGMASFATPQGIAALRDAAQLFERAGNAPKRAEALYWTAIAEQEAKNFSAALAAIQEALALHVEEAGFYDEFEALLLTGELQTELGEHAAAAAALERARTKAVQSKSRWNEWRSVAALADLHARRAQPDEARKAWAEAHSIATESDLWALGEVSRRWGDFEAPRGNADAARKRYAEAIKAQLEALAQLEANPEAKNRRMHVDRSRLGAAQSYLAAARLEVASGEPATAARHCRDGLALAAGMVTTADTNASGLEQRTARRNRELLEELRALASKLEQERPADKTAPIDPGLLQAIHVRGNDEVALSRSLVERLREQPELLTRSARWVPEVDQGQVVALRIFGVREDTLWGALGFQNGDRLKTVNGHAALALADSETAQRELRTASSVRIAFDRYRAPRELLFVVE